MPEDAKILRFPVRAVATLRHDEALERASAYLTGGSEEGADLRRASLIEEPDVLLPVCALLRERVDGNAADVLNESSSLYRAIASSKKPLGAFDERDYFLGEAALIAGIASRVLGKRSEAETWFDRAEAGFRHTVNPSPLLANVTYQRLAMRCEIGRYEEVAELAPMLATSFEKLGMVVEQAKCCFLEGLALKQSGRHEAALVRFQAVANGSMADRDTGLRGLALVNIGEIHVSEGRDDAASEAYSEAVPLISRAKRPAAVAHLKGVIGETLRRQGRLRAAVEAYRASIGDYEGLGMATFVAYLRIVLAQTLLEAGQPREAEWQIAAALPTIDEQKMVPEGFAAVALLRESVRQRKTDPNALLELREYLQAKN
jgi:tetratricopeptide (TPR) repeat protein